MKEELLHKNGGKSMGHISNESRFKMGSCANLQKFSVSRQSDFVFVVVLSQKITNTKIGF